MRISDWSSDVCSSDLGADSAASPWRNHEKLAAEAAPTRAGKVSCRASPGVLDPRRDAVHRREQRAQRVIVLAAVAAPAAQQLDLQQANRVAVWSAQADRQAQTRVAAQRGGFDAGRTQRVRDARVLHADATENRS